MTFQEFIYDLWGSFKVRSYSGRGMYGRLCVAIVSDTPLDDLQRIAFRLGELYGQGEYAPAMPSHVCMDGMGLSTVVYWPEEQWQETGLEEEQYEEENEQ